MAEASKPIRMAQPMKETSKRAVLMEKVSKPGLMGKSMKENGKITSSKAKGDLHLRQVKSMMATSRPETDTV